MLTKKPNNQNNLTSRVFRYFILGSIVIIFDSLFMSNCLSYPENLSDCGMNRLDDIYYTDYDVSIDSRTPNGIPVDKAGMMYDLKRIDTITLEVKECLKKNFLNLTFSQEVREKANCSGSSNFESQYWQAFKYGCWQVKIDPNWSVGCSGNQILSQGPPVPPGTQCGGKKDMITTRDCPCRYRMAVDGKTFVITPDARLFKDGLVRAITSCTNPWGHKLLSECASP